MGIIISEKGTIEKHLERQRNKGFGMIRDVKRTGSEYHVGKMNTMAQLLLYERTIVPALIYNLEGISYWKKYDWNYVEQTQSKLLKIILKLPESTPYGEYSMN